MITNNVHNRRIQKHKEQDINNLYIRLLSEELDYLNEDDMVLIIELANKCPYQEGSAVYKARTLNAIFNPTQMYDDIKLCNAMGVYKTSNTVSSSGLFDNENNYLQGIKPNYSRTILEENEIKIYPNPTDNVLNVSYSVIENCNFIIMDLTGRKIIEINLSNKSNHTMIDVSKLTTGVYFYQMSNGKQILKSDKIIIK